MLIKKNYVFLSCNIYLECTLKRHKDSLIPIIRLTENSTNLKIFNF